MQENSIMTFSDFNIGTITPEVATALETHNAIISSLENAANALVSLCRNLKHMRDTKGFTALGFEKFEDYTENACNIKKRQAYNYIQSYERLGSDFMQSNAQLGITKLLLLTEVCAVDRADFVEENDLEGMSVAEVKKLVAQNNDRGEQIDLLEEKLSSALDEIKELKDRPVDVAVEQPSEADIKKLVDKRTAEIQTEFAEKEKALKADYKQKLSAAKQKAQEKADAEKLKANVEKLKAVAEARSSAINEAKEEFKSKLEKAEQEKAEAMKQAEQMAAKLDKNADADLVTASLYFTEAQKQLDNFFNSVKKIEASNPERAEKLKAVAQTQLNSYISGRE